MTRVSEPPSAPQTGVADPSAYLAESPWENAAATPKTAGERIHNELTYRGVDWVANTAFAVGSAYVINRTKFGREHISQPVQAGLRKMLKGFYTDEQELAKAAELGVDFGSIMVGGTLIIPPMMLLDRHRIGISQWFDRKIYGDETVENDPRFSIRYDAMQHRAEKGFWTGQAARAIVLAPMLTAHMNQHSNPLINQWMYQPIANFSRWGAKQVGWQPQRMMQEGLHDKKGVFVSNWDYLHNMFGTDVSLTFIYSYAHEWVYKGLTNLFNPKANSANPQAVYTGGIDPEPPSATVHAAHHPAAAAQDTAVEKLLSGARAKGSVAV